MINVAVIGVGSMGQNHARVLFNLDDVELKAVVDADLKQASKIGKKYNVNIYSDYKEMFEKEDVDAVCVAVPTKFHKEVALYALNLKKHVLLEKPIAVNEKEGKDIIDCAKKNKVKLMIGHIERFNPAIIELKSRLDAGELGDIYKIDVQRIGPFPVRVTDVGVIIDLSVHDIDIIQYLMKSDLNRVYSETQQRLHPTFEDSVTALLRYKNGVLAILNVNYLSPTKVRQLLVFGKKGMFKVDYLNQELYFYENKSFSSDDWSSISEGDMKKIRVNKKEPLQGEIEAFLESINKGEDSSISGEDGLKALQIADAIRESAKKKKVMEL